MKKARAKQAGLLYWKYL